MWISENRLVNWCHEQDSCWSFFKFVNCLFHEIDISSKTKMMFSCKAWINWINYDLKNIFSMYVKPMSIICLLIWLCFSEKSFHAVKYLMCGSCHIWNVLIVVKYCNCCQIWMCIFFLLFGWGQLDQNWFTYLYLMDWPVGKLQVCN